MIVTLFKRRVPLPMRACGPTTENGPISTSRSIWADGSTDAVGAMRVVIPIYSDKQDK
jgi:hypothetical protein